MSKTMKAILCALLIITLFPGTMAAQNEETSYLEIIWGVNLRDKPSTSGKIVRMLQKGEDVKLLHIQGTDWYYVVDAAGTAGYISSASKYSSLFTKPALPEPNGEIIATVSFRTGPSTSQSRMRYLQKGELVRVLEKVNSYWYLIEDQHQAVGYVSTDPKYIDTVFGTAPSEPEQEYANEPNGTVIASVSFRTGPSTSSQRTRYLQKGEPIFIISKVNAHWYQIIDQHGIPGYVSSLANYISTQYNDSYKLLPQPIAAQQVIASGMKYIGTPYQFGADRNSILAFDCSAFVRRAIMDGIGLTLPSDSRKQAAHVQAVGKTTTDWTKLQPGDVMFFMSYKGYKPSDYETIDKNKETVTHTGIYLGEGRMLHTYSKESGGVRIDEISGRQWEYRFIFGGSVY